MVSLKDTAKTFLRADVTELPKLDLSLDIQTKTFINKDKQEVSYYFVEIDKKKYTIKSSILSKIKELLDVRPQTKFVKVSKGTDGQIAVIPLD